MRPLRAAIVAVLVAGSPMLPGCVGPATTDAAYRGKAVHAADAAQSAVQTAVLTARGQLDGRVLSPYGRVVLSNVEQDMSSVQGSFDSVQPPDDGVADQLRNTLDKLLTRAASDLTELRIAARRDDSNQMASVVKDLVMLAPKLESFSKEHS
jgi:hypothetical protein